MFHRAFIDFIIQNTTAKNSSFHLIGHSAGAHVVGGAGSAVTMGSLARVSGCAIKVTDKSTYSDMDMYCTINSNFIST
jgi:hypothetical protein